MRGWFGVVSQVLPFSVEGINVETSLYVHELEEVVEYVRKLEALDLVDLESCGHLTRYPRIDLH